MLVFAVDSPFVYMLHLHSICVRSTCLVIFVPYLAHLGTSATRYCTRKVSEIADLEKTTNQHTGTCAWNFIKSSSM